MERAVFLDRDGTINIDKGYVYRVEDFEFLEGAPEAISMMNRLGYLVIVLSNQSGVARGYFAEEDVNRLHAYINLKLVDYGAYIDRFYFCPHHPEGEVDRYRCQCTCRKPGIGMLWQACKDFSIDLEKSWVVGDRERDLFLNSNILLNRVLLIGEESSALASAKYKVRKNLWEFIKKDLEKK